MDRLYLPLCLIDVQWLFIHVGSHFFNFIDVISLDNIVTAINF